MCGIISWIHQDSWAELSSEWFISYVMCFESECVVWLLEFNRIVGWKSRWHHSVVMECGMNLNVSDNCLNLSELLDWTVVWIIHSLCNALWMLVCEIFCGIYQNNWMELSLESFISCAMWLESLCVAWFVELIRIVE